MSRARLISWTFELDRLASGLATGGSHYFTEVGLTAEADKAGYKVRHYQDYDFSAAHAVLVAEPSEAAT